MRIYLSHGTRCAYSCLSSSRYTLFSPPTSASPIIRSSASSISTFTFRSHVFQLFRCNASFSTLYAQSQQKTPATTSNMETKSMPVKCTGMMKFIEESLAEYLVKPGAPWGFVVYRVVYGDSTDDKWARLTQMLQKDVEVDLISEDVPNELRESLRQRHKLVIMDSQEKFEGMTTHDVRKHFRSWVVDELEVWLPDGPQRPNQEQFNDIRTRNRSAAEYSVEMGMGTRYNICVYIDESCLDSLDRAQPFPRPNIKLVWKDWVPPESPLNEMDVDDEMPPEIDLGWTDLPLVECNYMYSMLCNEDRWFDEYRIASQKLEI